MGIGAVTEPVFVYWNLRACCFSVRNKRHVIAHSHDIILKNVTFKISEAGRLRVVRTNHKTVHAFIHGTIDTISEDILERLSYNPLKAGYFYNKTTNEPVYSACKVHCKVIAKRPEIFYV